MVTPSSINITITSHSRKAPYDTSSRKSATGAYKHPPDNPLKNHNPSSKPLQNPTSPPHSHQAMPRDLLPAEVVDGDGAADVAVEGELDVEALLGGGVTADPGLSRQPHQPQRVLPDVDHRLERLGRLVWWRKCVWRLGLMR